VRAPRLAELTAPTGRDTLPAASPANAAKRRRGARAHRHPAGRGARTAAVACCIGQAAVHPLWGWPMLLGVLFLVYLFVGVFGASTLVGLLEEDFFGGCSTRRSPTSSRCHISTPWLADLLVGEYGLWTMGMTYALALILPIVTTFFLAFGVLEDSGYLPRLTVIANRLFA
jgi:ferrous iron transport protein B